MERGEDFRVGSWQDIARGRGEDIKGGNSAGSAAALQRVRRRLKWAGPGLAVLIVVATAVWLAIPPPEPKILKSDQLTADGREKHTDLATDGERKIPDVVWSRREKAIYFNFASGII
jgi:ferric-dicitrate binding protein FerR (iron transport regulator)